MIRDTRECVFNAELVAIASPIEGDTYRLDEVFLKTIDVGETVAVAGLKIYSYAAGERPAALDEQAMTKDTRVLLFLKRKNGRLVTVLAYWPYWVDDPSKIDQLRRQATTAVTLRTEWEKAAAIEEPQARVAALWPFLWDNGSKCFQLTREKLVEAGEVAGDFVAERFPLLSHSRRAALLPDCGRFGGDKLHAVLVSHLESLRDIYPSYAVDGEAAIRDEMSYELYYGTDGLTKFKRTGDLPFIRDLGVWAATQGLGDTCVAALSGLRAMPEKQNVPAIEAIWREFNARAHVRSHLNPSCVTSALAAHRSRQSIAALTRLLDDPKAGVRARSSLTGIVGEDLGPHPQPWLDWAAKHLASTTDNDSPD